MNMVTGVRRVAFLLPPDVIEGGATTMKLYEKIVDYGALHEATFAALMDAVRREDAESMKLHFDAVVYFEQMQRLAAMETRKHLLENAEGRRQSVEGRGRNG